MTPDEKRNRAACLEAEAAVLRREAFEARRLPDFWRKGQKVRMLRNSEFAWSAGDVMTIVEVTKPRIPAGEPQVFYTAGVGGYGRFYTTPSDVELMEEET